MYSRLDAAHNSTCIDIIPESTWEDTLAALSKKIQPDSLGVGYSLGGRVVLGLALAYPHLFRGLVLISLHAGLKEGRTQRVTDDEHFANEIHANRQQALDRFNQRDIFHPLDAPTHTFLESQRIDNTDTITQQLQVCGLGAMPYYEESLIELRVPVLYLSGVRDTKYDELAKRYKKKTAFAHHRRLDSDHRIPFVTPRTLSLNIEWFDKNVL